MDIASRIRTSVAFLTDLNNPDRLFKEDSPTRCCLFFKPSNIGKFVALLVSIAILVFIGKGCSLLIGDTNHICPSFTNATSNHESCRNNRMVGGYACILLWLIAPCALMSFGPILALYLLATLCIALYEVVLSLRSSCTLSGMFSVDNPDNIAHTVQDGESVDFARRLAIGKEPYGPYAIKYGTGLTLINASIIAIIAIFATIFSIILPRIGDTIAKIIDTPNWKCTSNTTLIINGPDCMVLGLLLTVVVCITFFFLLRCVLDLKRAVKSPDEVDPLRTKNMANIANYNTL